MGRRDYIIARERAHLKRKDHLWKPFGYLLLCVYWFKPLCWIAYIMWCKDIELACDEKVIKDMSFGDKKEYSRVLLSCASQRRLVSVCPLAFGEVGVKERVKSVLNYKKPVFWITILAIIVCIIVAICFLTNPQKDYSIRITIPAGSTEEIVYQEDYFYSDEEISPTGNKITIALGEGMGDAEVVLKPIEVKEENAYEPVYIIPGMPVKMDVEKGAWFKIGVNIQNPTTEDIDVYVNVRNVEVRISERETIEENSNESVEDVSEWITEELNVEKRDITHDGVADYIVTSMTYDPAYMDANVTLADKIKQQVMYDIVCVKVYEGSNTSDTYSEEQLLWSREYSRVHMGNGQLSVVCKDDKDYILTSNLWAGQGVATWEFEVFFLNETGDKEVIDEQTIEFELQEDTLADEECYAEFNHLLKEYINDGILIVACDIDFEQQLIRTKESQYIPWDYYSNAFVKFNNMEDEQVPINTLENVTMIMEKYKSYEGDIEIVNQSGGELATGEWYSIQRYEDGEWHRLDELIDGIWKEVEYCIPNGETTVLPTNWKTWYGELPAGKYRIVKEVYLHLEDRIDTYYLATEFEIE